MKRGRAIYKSTSLRVIKLICSIIIVTLFINLYFKAKTYFSESEVAECSLAFVLDYYLKYPHHLIFYFLFIFLPSLYYGFIRGVTFFEKGILINRGLPFFNFFIPYELISSFEIIKDNFFMSVKRKDNDDEYLFTVVNMDRALAILDQNEIKGSFGAGESFNRRGPFKIVFFFALAAVISYLFETIYF